MKDKDPQIDNEQRFIGLQDELIRQMNITYPSREGYPGVVVRVVSNEGDGRSQALMLGSNGEWGGKFDMMGWPIGKSPGIDCLIDEYAQITDEAFQKIYLGDDDHDEKEARENEYLQQHRGRLLGGLVLEMESTLQNLREMSDRTSSW